MTKMTKQQGQQVSLAKTLSNKDVLALGFGAMIGFGWVVLTKGWLLDAGPGGAALAFLVGGELWPCGTGVRRAHLSNATGRRCTQLHPSRSRSHGRSLDPGGLLAGMSPSLLLTVAVPHH